jgi:hypothetical protein
MTPLRTRFHVSQPKDSGSIPDWGHIVPLLTYAYFSDQSCTLNYITVARASRATKASQSNSRAPMFELQQPRKALFTILAE